MPGLFNEHTYIYLFNSLLKIMENIPTRIQKPSMVYIDLFHLLLYKTSLLLFPFLLEALL